MSIICTVVETAVLEPWLDTRFPREHNAILFLILLVFFVYIPIVHNHNTPSRGGSCLRRRCHCRGLDVFKSRLAFLFCFVIVLCLPLHVIASAVCGKMFPGNVSYVSKVKSWTKGVARSISCSLISILQWRGGSTRGALNDEGKHRKGKTALFGIS